MSADQNDQASAAVADFASLPIAKTALSAKERDEALARFNDFLGWAGNPAQWGNNTKLGVLVKRMHNLRAEIAMTPPRERQGGAQ